MTLTRPSLNPLPSPIRTAETSIFCISRPTCGRAALVSHKAHVAQPASAVLPSRFSIYCTPTPPLPIPIWRALERVHPNPSQIGVGFSDVLPNWRGFRFLRAPSCPLWLRVLIGRGLQISPKYKKRNGIRSVASTLLNLSSVPRNCHSRSSSPAPVMSFATLC